MKELEAPIPGQSLTDTPRNAPWERPPEFVEVGDVLNYYIERMSDDDAMDDMAASFEMGADINTIVQGMIKMGTMNGLHTLQAGMLAAPSLAAFIKASMATYGIDAKESQVSDDELREDRANNRIRSMIKARMDAAGEEMPDMREEAAPMEEPMPEQPELPLETAEPSLGLMAQE